MEYVWSLQGTLAQHIYSPQGEIEGLLLLVGNVPVQFVVAPEQREEAAALQPSQRLELEGTVRPPPHKHAHKHTHKHAHKHTHRGEAEHDVYDLFAIGKVDGKQPPAAHGPSRQFAGVITRFNYAKHGEPNGYILDSGDFIHTKPQGFKQLGLEIGEHLDGRGAGSRLSSGAGWVFEAEKINGTALV